MKSAYGLLLGLAFLSLMAWAADKTSTPDKSQPLLAGTWQMTMQKYGDAKELTPAPSDHTSIKFVTDTHFIWIWVDPKTKKITTSMGGRYELKGNSYVETPEYATEGMEDYLGKPQKFTAKVEGDQWTHSGQLSPGTPIEEVWKRVK
jgi:hypothetical protein